MNFFSEIYAALKGSAAKPAVREQRGRPTTDRGHANLGQDEPAPRDGTDAVAESVPGWSSGIGPKDRPSTTQVEGSSKVGSTKRCPDRTSQPPGRKVEMTERTPTEADLSAFSETYESLRNILCGFIGGLVDHIRTPTGNNLPYASEEYQDRNAERYAISQTTGAMKTDDSKVWIESELLAEHGEILFAFCESVRMVGEESEGFPVTWTGEEFERQPCHLDAIIIQEGHEPFTGKNDPALVVTVTGKGHRMVEDKSRPVGEATNFLTGGTTVQEFEKVEDEQALVFETVGYIPIDLTDAVNFTDTESFLGALQAQVRLTRRSQPVEIRRDYSNLADDREIALANKYARKDAPQD